MTNSEGKRGYPVSCSDFGSNPSVVFYAVTGEAVRRVSSFSRMENDIFCSVRFLVCVRSGIFKGEYFCEVFTRFIDCPDCSIPDSSLQELLNSVIGRYEFSFRTLLYCNNALI